MITLEQQVCTLEQAKKLKELGVKQEGQFTWAYSKLNEIWDICLLTPEALEIAGNKNAYSAFTCAELGVMLPCNRYLSGHKHHDTFMASLYSKETHEFMFSCHGDSEAQARAELLIKAIEVGEITVEEVNKLLSE